MDAGKQMLQDEQRIERANDVRVQFIDGLFQHFNTIAAADELDKKTGDIKIRQGEIKYMGVLMEKDPHKNDFCTCPDFYFRQSDEFKKANPAAYQCKHLHAARQVRYGEAKQ